MKCAGLRAELAVAFALVLLSTVACKHSQPPATPGAPWGPDSAWQSAAYTCSVVTTAQGNVRYVVDWSDAVDTSDVSYGSGETAAMTHVWNDAGHYDVRARAFLDADPSRVSDFSPAKIVKVNPNAAPESPTVAGPSSARPGETLTYRFSSVDPDGDSVHYVISWGDGAVSAWSPASPSGEDYIQTHTYTDTTRYCIKAKAKDGRDAESEWSDSLRVAVGSFPPEAPARPDGPTSCSTGVVNYYRTRAVHPLHDSISIQFFWGDATGSWGPMVASNQFCEEPHTWSLPGTYKIAARARDAFGCESPWSDTLVVTVDTLHGTPRRESPGHGG